MLIVIALGGNAMLPRGAPPDAELQRRNLKHAASAVAELAREHQVVVTHGNGPQIGLLALQSEAVRDIRTYPLDILGAESEGMIGYVLEQELRNELDGREVASLLTQVVVDALDPAFRNPTKPIGPIYREDEARKLANERGWFIAPDGAGWRRVVASPMPRSIVELPTIRLLVDSGIVVICAGGGGVPVIIDSFGACHGVEAVIDKDWATALLARRLGADLLLLLTDVPAVERDHGTDQATPIALATPAELHDLPLDAGSMGPKVGAACWFVETTGTPAAIGAIDDAPAIVRRDAGTTIVGCEVRTPASG